jgi:Response regulator containing CheY-like receiver domain and AraC-type DNA-binding domain
MNVNGNVIEKLTGSAVYQDYERAFSEATGLPVALRPVESWQLPHRGKRTENAFCGLMATKSRSCAACLQTQQKLAERARESAQSVTCAHGMTDTAVPVRLGDKLIGFLQTGQVFRAKPTEAQFDRSAKLAAEWGVPVERERLHEAFFSTRVVSNKQHSSVVKLLSIFAEHLAMVSNRIFVEQQNSELPVITRAKEYIQQNQADDLSLGQVAKAVNTSTFYFCKLFKKAIGVNFTEYVSRIRVEKAKNLLLNPNLRVSEIAYEVGFQSLTHFNRVFKKLMGRSPTDYRDQFQCA